MYSIEVGGDTLSASPDSISCGVSTISLGEIESIIIYATNNYLHGALVEGERSITVVDRNQSMIKVDCSRIFPTRDVLDHVYGNVYQLICSTVVPPLVGRFLETLDREGSVRIAGAHVERDGVWIDGSWKILWFKAKPRLVHWTDLKISGQYGAFLLQSRSNPRLRTDIQINGIRNAVVLDALIRYLLHANNWRDIAKCPSSQ